MPAQIFAAAAASLSGPATSRNCIPSPVLLSFTMMIGRNAASGAFALDLRSPRHNARKPPTELAPPTSTPNSVRWTFDGASAASGSSLAAAGGAEATTSGLDAGDAGAVAATVVLGGGLGSSFAAAGSGGPIIDFEAINGAGLDAAGGFVVAIDKDDTVAGAGSGTVAVTGGFSVVAAMAGFSGGAAAATDGAGGNAGGVAGEGAVVATGKTGGEIGRAHV